MFRSRLMRLGWVPGALFIAIIPAIAPAAPPAPNTDVVRPRGPNLRIAQRAQAHAQAQDRRYAVCLARVKADAAAALVDAQTWQRSMPGPRAHQCAGLALEHMDRFAEAQAAFETGARMALQIHPAQAALAATLQVQAGNAALAANNPDAALDLLNQGLASGQLKGEAAGEAFLDRARAKGAIGDLAGARADLTQATQLAPKDPLGWLLAAVVARRAGDLESARTAIDRALALAPDDAEIAMEAGNVAAAQGVSAAARSAWEAAIRADPDSDAAKRAAAALKDLPTEGTRP